MRTFAGFPNGRLRATAVPDVFFAELLGSIEDLAELKVRAEAAAERGQRQHDSA